MDGRISNFWQVASVRRYEMTEGKERGLRVVDCDNGKLRFLLNESKALDVMQVYHEGQNISFVSKNGFTARETAFLNRFEGGMLYTCGLDSAGNREGYAMHGTLHNIPARVVQAKCEEDGIEVEAETEDSALFGKNLVLHRKVTTKIGSSRIEISDTLENRGWRDEEYCLLYHVNVGYPMLDDGCELQDFAEEVIPRNEWAKKHAAMRSVMEEPQANREEMCYFMRGGKPEVSLTNRRLGKKFILRWSNETLTDFVQWKSMACGDYALGLEPCTTQLDEGFAYKILAPKKSVNFRLEIEIETIK